ncbi:MAG: CPBP family glutamic-type intramembrane protease [Anaerolineae bacterium]
MDIFDAIVGRRSVRQFLPDPVPQEDIERILGAARGGREIMLDLPISVILALAIPWVVWLTLGTESKAMGLAMMAPGLVALVLMLSLSRLKVWQGPLVRFSPPGYALLAWGVPVLWVGVLAGLNLLLGTARVGVDAMAPKDRGTLIARLVFVGVIGLMLGVVWLWPRLPWGTGLPLGFASWPSAAVTVPLLLLFALALYLLIQIRGGRTSPGWALARFPRYVGMVLIVGALLPVLGEELAWRGFLFPRLAEYNVHLALIGTWVVWWLFHGPLGFLSPALRDVPRWALALGLLAIAGPTFFTGWLLLQTGSLWPAAIFHLTWNLVNPALLGNTYTDKEGLLHGRIWLINGEGVIGAIVSLLTVAPAFHYLTVH